eukprot:EG_transcript_20063
MWRAEEIKEVQYTREGDPLVWVLQNFAAKRNQRRTPPPGLRPEQRASGAQLSRAAAIGLPAKERDKRVSRQEGGADVARGETREHPGNETKARKEGQKAKERSKRGRMPLQGLGDWGGEVGGLMSVAGTPSDASP